MSRRLRISLTALVAWTLLIAGALPASAGGQHGTGTPGGGGISGNGGGGSGAAWDGPCAPGSVMAVYNSAVFAPVAKGSTLNGFIYPAYSPSPSNAAAMDKMVFLIDPATKLAIGPPSLHGYTAGEGLPPGVVSIGQTSLPPYSSNSTFPGYAPWWDCYTGTPPTPGSVPFSSGGTPPRHDGATTTNTVQAATVMEPVKASLAQPCPLTAIAPGEAISLPPAALWSTYPASGYKAVDSTWPGCPESEVTIGQNSSWRWLAFDQPVLTNRSDCASGSGAYLWDWTPASYTNRHNHCTATGSDSATFIHVLNNPPGLSIKSSVNWQDWCSGTYTNTDYGVTFVFPPSNGPQTQTWTSPPPASATITATLDCDGPPFIQTNTASPKVAVDQIESVPNG